jgi:hypothetical protein
LSIKAAEKIFECREKVAALFGCSHPENVVFTMNCTHALNCVIKGVLKKGDHVVVSDFEHNAVIRPLETLKRKGMITYDTATVSLTDNNVTLENFKSCIKSNTKMIICTHASNVTGRVLPIREMGQLCKERKILFTVDAAQSAGVLDINIKKQNIEENWPKNMPNKPKFRDEVKTVEDIDYFPKVTAITTFLEINSTVVSRIRHETPFSLDKVQIVNYLSEVVNYIRRTRNELSHRGKIKTKNIDALIEKFESQKKPQKDAVGNWVYPFNTQNQNDKDVKYYMWYKYTPWEDVIYTIHLLESAAAEAFKTEDS